MGLYGSYYVYPLLINDNGYAHFGSTATIGEFKLEKDKQANTWSAALSGDYDEETPVSGIVIGAFSAKNPVSKNYKGYLIILYSVTLVSDNTSTEAKFDSSFFSETFVPSEPTMSKLPLSQE